ncbi:MAG: dihydroxy-acid dehydratase [Alicyclobacillus herbarius]|uniref:dihydroxy-acid dehydratase domain-containing protein n=1 Tax=Alicyclobacillus herbarius TaxID=122960 RepID=UPI002353BB07|nr:dihydroxy-acid dehydratase [Alicyclobacillus herbarius]MCL6633827.1 dihydroxy-acid dehydratase [Alicyclobacillus herbarius]
MERLRINNPINPYQWNVQGKANEPITVAGLLDKARLILGPEAADTAVTWTLDEIYTRLEENAPRIAIIGGSWDHPAHVMDLWTVARSALSLWAHGAVPFYAAIPVLCDGTAQNTMGMSYSLQSRQAIASMVINHLEAQSYHGAFVIQSCDKQPFGVLCGLAQLDVVRRRRGEAPVMATFAPVHVLKGGTIPEKLRAELEGVAARAEAMGLPDVAYDLRDAMAYILQCSSNTAFQGVLTRAVKEGVITHAQHKLYEQVLAVNTCDSAGGICAFHGTGNSSRDAMAGLGLVHPTVELLTVPPTRAQIDECVGALLAVINRPEFSVSELVRANIRNAIRVHSAAGGSTNLMMHIVAAMIYAGQPYSLYDVERVCQEYPIPDLFDYSLTEGRDIYALALQCGAGYSRGMETLIYELVQNGVPMDLDALTITGTTWRQRLEDKKGLAADNVKDNPIILSSPRRPFSGVDILRSNFFESAVVKISGMATEQLDEFDDKLAVVVYFQDEDEANQHLLNPELTEHWRKERVVDEDVLRALYRLNGGQGEAPTDYDDLFRKMVEERLLKVAVVIAGQGPEAYGMPEMFTPMQHINANRALQKLSVLLSDGRYSGVTYGAAIGHVTPEAIRGGGILYLRTGDVVQLGFRRRRIDLLDSQALREGRVQVAAGDWQADRQTLAQERKARMLTRRRRVSAANRLTHCTDAAHGVVPLEVWEEAVANSSQDGGDADENRAHRTVSGAAQVAVSQADQ